MDVFASVDDVAARLHSVGYIPSTAISTSLFLAERMQKPILVEGPAGVGKTELARAVAQATSAPLLRLQCYEGLDEAKALYEWQYPKQLLYTQILRDKIGEQLQATTNLAAAVEEISQQDDAFYSERFLLERPLLAAIRTPQRAVLLIDEVDRSDAEFEAFLLEILSDFQVSIPELGTLKAKHVPLVILTSNSVREMTDALRRRCLHLYLDYPDAARELEIVKARVPAAVAALQQQAVDLVQTIRKLDLKKPPSVSETIDWLRALVLLGANDLQAPEVEESLHLLAKYQGDFELIASQLPQLVQSTGSR